MYRVGFHFYRSLDIETRYDRYLSYRIYKWRMQIRAVWL